MKCTRFAYKPSHSKKLYIYFRNSLFVIVKLFVKILYEFLTYLSVNFIIIWLCYLNSLCWIDIKHFC